jgi:hypothetical protein
VLYLDTFTTLVVHLLYVFKHLTSPTVTLLISPSLAAAPTPPSLINLHTLFWGHAVLDIVVGGGPIWTAWPVLLVSRRASISTAPLLLYFVLLFLSSPRSIPISLCGIFSCLLLVDLSKTLVLSFCCLSEAWGGSLLRLSPPFLKTRFVTSNRWRDLHWLGMFSWQWV